MTCVDTRDRHQPIIVPLGPDPEDDGIFIDWFAGGGGASEGARAAGWAPTYALNHNQTALWMHEVNHPECLHIRDDAFAPKPRALVGRRRVRGMWFSPDCTHHSKARGKAPKSPRIRGLAWAIIPWATPRPDYQPPDFIFMENVEEWLDWGPLFRKPHPLAGQADPARKGKTRKLFFRAMVRRGWRYEYRIIRVSNIGLPTIRRRLVVVFCRTGEPIVWPEQTHARADLAAAQGLKPWVEGASVIDFSLPCPSIFMSQAEAKAQGLNIKRPLVPKSEARIAEGVKRHVVTNANPFIVHLTHGGRVHEKAKPLPTVTCANRGELAVVAAHLVKNNFGEKPCQGLDEPLHTVTTQGNRFGLVETELAPFTVPRYGEREGQAPRTRALGGPLGVVVPSANGDRLVACALGRQFGTNQSGRSMRDPLGAIQTGGGKGGGHDQVIACHLSTYFSTGHGSSLADPVRTVTGEDRHALTACFLEQANTDMVGHDCREPISTIVGRGTTQRLIEVRLEAIGAPLGSRRRKVLAFLWKHFGEPDEADWTDPTVTLQARLRFGLVKVEGVWREIADIGMRMLTVRELFRAQGFPDDYVIDRDPMGRKITPTAATLMAGNAVPPGLAEQVIAANLGRRPAPPPRRLWPNDERVAA